jgi:hypothetical protein
MAHGNLAISRNYCPSCNGMTKFERSSLVWGLGDFVMVLCTLLLWIPIKLGVYSMTTPWRCSSCGARPGRDRG